MSGCELATCPATPLNLPFDLFGYMPQNVITYFNIRQHVFYHLHQSLPPAQPFVDPMGELILALELSN